jgi:hypothetical protein
MGCTWEFVHSWPLPFPAIGCRFFMEMQVELQSPIRQEVYCSAPLHVHSWSTRSLLPFFFLIGILVPTYLSMVVDWRIIWILNLYQGQLDGCCMTMGMGAGEERNLLWQPDRLPSLQVGSAPFHRCKSLHDLIYTLHALATSERAIMSESSTSIAWFRPCFWFDLSLIVVCLFEVIH